MDRQFCHSRIIIVGFEETKECLSTCILTNCVIILIPLSPALPFYFNLFLQWNGNFSHLRRIKNIFFFCLSVFFDLVRSHTPSYPQYCWLLGWPDPVWEGTTKKHENRKARIVGEGASGDWLPKQDQGTRWPSQGGQEHFSENTLETSSVGA